VPRGASPRQGARSPSSITRMIVLCRIAVTEADPVRAGACRPQVGTRSRSTAGRRHHARQAGGRAGWRGTSGVRSCSPSRVEVGGSPVRHDRPRTSSTTRDEARGSPPRGRANDGVGSRGRRHQGGGIESPIGTARRKRGLSRPSRNSAVRSFWAAPSPDDRLQGGAGRGRNRATTTQCDQDPTAEGGGFFARRPRGSRPDRARGRSLVASQVMGPARSSRVGHSMIAAAIVTRVERFRAVRPSRFEVPQAVEDVSPSAANRPSERISPRHGVEGEDVPEGAGSRTLRRPSPRHRPRRAARRLDKVRKRIAPRRGPTR